MNNFKQEDYEEYASNGEDYDIEESGIMTPEEFFRFFQRTGSTGIRFNNNVPCLWDGLEPGTYGLSCSCPKCAATC